MRGMNVDEQGTKKRSHKVLKGILIVFGVLVLLGIIGSLASTSSNNAKSAGSSTSSSGDSSASAAASQPAQTAPRQPVVLLDISGSGTKRTQKFTTSGDWTLVWSYDCTAALGAQGNFIVTVYNADGSADYSDTDVNQLGASGSDTQYYYDSGTHYLSVNSECSWHVTAKG
jgi:hypothetical protein